ncbi:MAG: sigma-70 family RNA polymerase sigma factor [Deltaproteobacteria bacterium]|nr:sigma-70 family RNA polymerase sigma factor [Deltaproteobacteria bacterium]
MKINFILSHPRGREEFEAFQRELENGTLKIQDFRAEIGKYPNKINYKRRTEQLILGLTEVTNGLRQGQSARDIWEFSSFDEWIFCDNYNLKRGEREFLSDWEEDQSLWNYRLEKGADIVFALWLRTPILDGILAKLKKEIQRESEESEKRAASPLALKRLDFWEKELRRVELGEGKNQEDIIEFLGLMDSIINSFTQKLLYDLNSHDYEDFFQEARISSLKAIRHYDPPFDANFVTIAFFWILATAKRFRDNQNRAIKLSQNGQKLFREFEKNAASHKSPLGETPFSWEIAQELMISLGDIAENENGNMSEEASFSGLENERDDFISSLAAPTIDIERELDAEKMRAQFGENFWRALSKLPDERMIQIIILRFGFLGEKIPTLKMVGDLFGRTAQWAKKVERQALNLLRDNADMDCLKIFLD